MQAASGEVAPSRRRARRRLRTSTLIIGALLVLLSLGTMVAVLAGVWPIAGGQQRHEVVPTPWPYIDGLKAEIVGPPEQRGEQWVVKVQVTNNVQVPSDGASSGAGQLAPVKVNNATLRVLFYNKPLAARDKEVVGSGVGNVVDLEPGASKTVDVYATDVGQFEAGAYEVVVDSMWTERDKPKNETGGQSAAPFTQAP